MALQSMTREKAAGEDEITVDLFKEGGGIMLEKLEGLYTQCPRILSAPENWKNADVILIDKKGDVKELEAH